MSARADVLPSPRLPSRVLGVAVLAAALSVGGAACGGDETASNGVAVTGACGELHETVMAGGMGGDTTMPSGSMGMGSETTMPMGQMTMRQVDSIELPAGEAVGLAPGGYHVMLFELAAPLEVGTSITVTLTLSTAGTITVDVPVLDEAP